MQEIKTREINIKNKIIKNAHALQITKNIFIKTKKKAEQTQDQKGENTNVYATEKVTENVNDITRKAFSETESFGRKSLKKAPQTIRQIKKKTKDIKNATKGTIKATGKAVKTAKVSIKTSLQAANATVKTAKANIKASQKAFQIAKLTAKVTTKAVIATVKAAIAAVKGTIALIAAGGWVAVVIILFVCMVAFIFSFPFGIFSGGGTNNTPSVSQVVSDINNDWNTKINQMITDSGKVDSIVYTINGTTTNSEDVQNWADVLSVFTVKISTNDIPTNIEMDENKINLLKKVFFDMNTATSKTETKDGKSTLIIEITSKSYIDIISDYGLNPEQQRQIIDLMSWGNKEMLILLTQ